MSREKNSKKKPMIAINFCFLVDFIRPTGPMVTMVTRYIGGLSQVLLVKMSWEKDSNKISMIENNFCFLVDLIRPTGPLVTMVIRHTHRSTISTPLVKISWGKKSKKKPRVLNNFCFLFNFQISNID